MWRWGVSQRAFLVDTDDNKMSLTPQQWTTGSLVVPWRHILLLTYCWLLTQQRPSYLEEYNWLVAGIDLCGWRQLCWSSWGKNVQTLEPTQISSLTKHGLWVISWSAKIWKHQHCVERAQFRESSEVSSWTVDGYITMPWDLESLGPHSDDQSPAPWRHCCWRS